MALTNCPECGHKVSDQADACPSCGRRLTDRLTKLELETELNRINYELEQARKAQTRSRTYYMNIAQRCVILLGFVVILVLGIYPPCTMSRSC